MWRILPDDAPEKSAIPAIMKNAILSQTFDQSIWSPRENMPVLLLLCLNNFLLFNHILPRERTKCTQPINEWVPGEMAMEKVRLICYHQFEWPTWPDCMEGNEYKLLLMDKVQCWVAQNIVSIAGYLLLQSTITAADSPI